MAGWTITELLYPSIPLPSTIDSSIKPLPVFNTKFFLV